MPGLVLSDGEQQVRDILAACDSSGLMTDYELDSMAQCSYGQLESMCTAGSDYGSWDYSYGTCSSDECSTSTMARCGAFAVQAEGRMTTCILETACMPT